MITRHYSRWLQSARIWVENTSQTLSLPISYPQHTSHSLVQYHPRCLTSGNPCNKHGIEYHCNFNDSETSYKSIMSRLLNFFHYICSRNEKRKSFLLTFFFVWLPFFVWSLQVSVHSNSRIWYLCLDFGLTKNYIFWAKSKKRYPNRKLFWT